MKATIKDVAQMANVSAGTVSNFLNKKGKTTQENKLAIEKAIETLGYERNEIARSLRTKTTTTIGVLIPSLSNNTIMKMVSAIETNVKKEGYGLLVISHNSNREEFIKALEYLEQRTCAIILNPSFQEGKSCSNILEKIKIPVVSFDNQLKDFKCDKVLVDHKSMVSKTLEKLIETGHKEIGILPGPKQSMIAQSKFEGYKETLEKYQMEIKENNICFTDFTKQDGTKGVEQLLKQSPSVTAALVGSNRITNGAIIGLQKADLYKKICLIGYDTTDYSDILSPAICCVAQPVKQIGEMVSMIVLKRIRGDYESFPTSIKLEANIENLETLDYYK